MEAKDKGASDDSFTESAAWSNWMFASWLTDFWGLPARFDSWETWEMHNSDGKIRAAITFYYDRQEWVLIRYRNGEPRTRAVLKGIEPGAFGAIGGAA